MKFRERVLCNAAAASVLIAAPYLMGSALSVILLKRHNPIRLEAIYQRASDGRVAGPNII